MDDTSEHKKGFSNRLSPVYKNKFIKTLLSTGGNVSAACKAINISRTCAYNHKNKDQSFSEMWDDAVENGTDDLLQEATRRAFTGIEDPVFYKGVQCGSVQKYSDSLLQFLIRGQRKQYNTSYQE